MLKPYDFQNIYVWHSHDYNHGVERDKFKHVFSEHSILSSEFIYVFLFSFVCVFVCPVLLSLLFGAAECEASHMIVSVFHCHTADIYIYI